MKITEALSHTTWCGLSVVHLQYIRDACLPDGQVHEDKAYTAVRGVAHFANAFLTALEKWV